MRFTLRQAAIALGFATTLGLAAMAGSLGLFRGMGEVGEDFLAATSGGRSAEAQSFLASSLAKSKGLGWSRDLLERTGIADFRQVEWGEPKSDGSLGEISGTATKADGERVPFTMLFVREQLRWKLYSLRRPFTGDLPKAIVPLLPDRSERITMVKRAVQDFAASLKTRDMSYFRSTLSKSKQEHYSTAKLDAAFRNFFEIDEDLASLSSVEPLINDAAEERNGEVTLSGFYPTQPKQVHFVQRYAYEKADWRLLSFKINMQ